MFSKETSRSQINQSRQVEADAFSSASSASDIWEFTMTRKLQRAQIQSMPFLARGSFKSVDVSCALNRTKHFYEKDIAQDIADILDMAVMDLCVSPKIMVCPGRADWAAWAHSPKIRLSQFTKSKFRIPSTKLCQFISCSMLDVCFKEQSHK